MADPSTPHRSHDNRGCHHTHANPLQSNPPNYLVYLGNDSSASPHESSRTAGAPQGRFGGQATFPAHGYPAQSPHGVAHAPPNFYINTSSAQAAGGQRLVYPDTPRRLQFPSSSYRALITTLRHCRISLAASLRVKGIPEGTHTIYPDGTRIDAHVAFDETPENTALVRALLRPGPAPGLRPSYNQLRVPELKQLIKQHGLSAGSVRRKEAYVAILVAGLGARPGSCGKFFDLPLEIRDMIYGFVVLEQDTLLTVDPTLCSQPALALVNREIRKEVLPIFYGINRFALTLETGFNRRSGGRIVLSPSSKKFLGAIGEDNVKALGMLKLQVEIVSKMITLDLDLGYKRSHHHMMVDRTCGFHEVGSMRCGRWRGCKTVEEVFQSVEKTLPKGCRNKEGEEGARMKIREWIGVVIGEEMGVDLFGEETGFDAQGVQKFAEDIGEFLYCNRQCVP